MSSFQSVLIRAAPTVLFDVSSFQSVLIRGVPTVLFDVSSFQGVLIREVLQCIYHSLCECVYSTVSWVCTEIRPFGDAPSPRRRVGCALIGSNLMICGGTRYMYYMNIHLYM